MMMMVTTMLMIMMMMMMIVSKNTCKVRRGKVAAKTRAEIFGLLETLGFVFHKVAGTICIAGIVPENRFRVVFRIYHKKRDFCCQQRQGEIGLYWQPRGSVVVSVPGVVVVVSPFDK